MKIKELDNGIIIDKTFEERKKDAMNWFTIAVKVNLRFLKKYNDENKFGEFVETQKQLASFCEKFRRTIGAIKNEESNSLIKKEIDNLFEIVDF